MVTEESLRRISAKTWDELEAIDEGGRLFFRDSIKRIGAKGVVEDVPVLMCVPREEKRRARIEARAWAAREGLDPDKDADIFDDMCSYCELALCLRDVDSPKTQFQTAETLEKHFDRASISDLKARQELYADLIDPRPSVATEDDMLAVAATIARVGNVSPLVAFDSRSQTAYIIFTADRLTRLMT